MRREINYENRFKTDPRKTKIALLKIVAFSVAVSALIALIMFTMNYFKEQEELARQRAEAERIEKERQAMKKAFTIIGKTLVDAARQQIDFHQQVLAEYFDLPIGRYACGSEKSSGKEGSQLCIASLCTACTHMPEEICYDGQDNNQDGNIDEGCLCKAGTVTECNTGLSGICAMGSSVCLSDGSNFGPCEVLTMPRPEVCHNHRDDDCDGAIDEAGCTRNRFARFDTEERCNNIDDNGNGIIDENCACVPGSSIPCDTGYPGTCGTGEAICNDDGIGFSNCRMTSYPVKEICNDHLDNDCDGVIDKDCNPQPKKRG